jgi:UPF0716 protein FxsA
VLVLLALVLPFVELWILVQIAHRIGTLPTLGFLVATAIIGVQLARAEGLRVLSRVQTSLAERRAPEGELASALLVFVGGVLLVVPGVITDVAGILLLLPPSRAVIARLLRRRWEAALRAGRVVVVQGASPRERRDLDDEIIDVEAEPVDHGQLPEPKDKE